MDACWITAAGAQPVPPDDIKEVRSRDGGVLWVDLDYDDERGMALLTELVEAEPADLRECATRTPVPKLHVYADHHFSAINGLARGSDGHLHFQPLKTFMNPRLLVTVLGPVSRTLPASSARRELTMVRERIDAHRLVPSSAFEVVSAVRLELLHSQEDLVGAAARRIAQLEHRVMACDPARSDRLLEEMVGLRHDLQTVRTNAAQTREIYDHLLQAADAREGLMPVNVRGVNDLRQGFHHLQNTADLEREYLQDVLELFETRVSTELNRFIRKITAWGTIGIAWTVIAGIYGMNFRNMPELNWTYGYPTALGLMLVVGSILAAVFRRRGWL
jgi:magnesium transporter